MPEKFKVEYLRHSIFKDAESVTAEVSKGGLVELLENGMVSVLSAKMLVEEDSHA